VTHKASPQIFYWLEAARIFPYQGAHGRFHALVFFISISAEPSVPGPGKSGIGMEWVLYGAPSAEKARVWAHAQYDKYEAEQRVPQTITEFLVLPMSDTLYTGEGSEPIAWTSLPSMRNLDSNDIDDHQDFYASVGIQVPKKAQGKAGDTKEISLEQLRAAMEKETKGPSQWNWDESKAWYYICYASSQAMLVKSVNIFAATIPYGKGVRGTPIENESARIAAWQELTKYSE
jgi:hypothetical protein